MGNDGVVRTKNVTARRTDDEVGVQGFPPLLFLLSAALFLPSHLPVGWPSGPAPTQPHRGGSKEAKAAHVSRTPTKEPKLLDEHKVVSG